MGLLRRRRESNAEVDDAVVTDADLDDFRSRNARFDLLYSRVSQQVKLFAERRRTVKRRAAYASLGTTGGAGVTTLLLGLRETFGYETEIVTTAFIISAAGTLLAVWDRHFKHAALWVQRTIVLNSLQQLRFDMAIYAVGREDQEIEDRVTDKFAAALRSIEDGDINTWLIIRSDITPVTEIDPRRASSPTLGVGPRDPRRRT